MPIPLPPTAAVRNVLTDLLNRRVTVVPGDPQQLDPACKASAATYRDDDGQVAAVCLWDLTLSTAAAAAMGKMSAMRASSLVADGELAGELPELFYEVANVVSGLLNTTPAPHSVLHAVHAVPGPVPADVAAVVRNPGRRVDYEITMEGFDPGTMTWMVPAVPRAG